MTEHTHGAAWRCGMAVLVLALVALLGGCRSDLFSDIAEEDANEIIDTLYAAGIDSRKEPAGEKTFRVQVQSSQMADALRTTRERGLPRQRFTDLCTLFKKDSLVSTPSEERMRFICGTAQGLQRTISTIDGVISAGVHPVIPYNDPMADKVKPTSASVLIKHSANVDLQALGPTIKNLVVHAIEGLTAENVTLNFIAASPPLRQQPAVAALPSWFNWVLGAAVLLLALIGAALGFVLWRYRQLALTLHNDHVAPLANANTSTNTNVALGVPWLPSLWRGWADWSAKARRAAGWLPVVHEVSAQAPNAQRFAGATDVTPAKADAGGRP
jgi:type III secretion protein J